MPVINVYYDYCFIAVTTDQKDMPLVEYGKIHLNELVGKVIISF